MEETYKTYNYCPICGRSFRASDTWEKCQYCNDYLGVKVNPLQPVTAKTEQETNEQPKRVSAEEIRDKYSRQWFNETDDIDDPNTGYMAWPDVLKAMKEYENIR